ncbi:unnamed protein product [Merluccius merluccius]
MSRRRQLTGRQGEMVVLRCTCLSPGTTWADFTWTHQHPSDSQQVKLSQGLSYGDMPVQGERLVVLRASAEREGNYSSTLGERSGKERKITVSLVFQKITEAHHLGNYTCKLECTLHHFNITISLALKAQPVSAHIVSGLAVLFVLLLVVSFTLIFLRGRVHITLVLRDKLGCHGNASDGKHYDAYMVTYESHSYTALSEEDRRWMEKVLEDQLGYRLCLHDRDATPGEATADAVMRGILQSRRVVLVPSSVDHPDAGLGSGLPSVIHTALVEKKSRLVLILTKTTQEEEEALAEPPQDGGSSSLPESLRLLTQAGSSVTWEGPCSRPLSSSFWKHLRYCLPAPHKLTEPCIPL